MINQHSERRLETEAIVIGYAMSRLDKQYLSARQCLTWRKAFDEAAASLSIPPASLKNLRDEFDPIHGNHRRGWHNRPLRRNRQRVMAELCEVSDAALLELVARILIRDNDSIDEAMEALVVPSKVVYNVAERLRTGRLAEEFFLANSELILNVKRNDILDLRQAAQGFDFGIRNEPQRAIEIKGLSVGRGEILFTDREWSEATKRKENYWLVVVGHLKSNPKCRVFPNPEKVLQVACRYQTTVTALWRSNVSVAV